MFAKVDDEDFEVLNQWNWYAQKGYKTFYACRSVFDSKGRKSNLGMHRFLLGLKKGDKKFVDHKDSNGLNNQKNNIRVATYSENSCNIGIKSNNTSGFKGVSFCKITGLWHARIMFNKKNIPVGRFKEKQEAALARDRLAKQYHGQFAYLNLV